MDVNKLEKALISEPTFRLKQAKQAVFKGLIEKWDEATTLSVELRDKLINNCPLGIKADVFVSDNRRSAKALSTLKDGLRVESVLMRHQAKTLRLCHATRDSTQGINDFGRNTICVSSQVGCPLGCVFCATGQTGFKRNLTGGEIAEQVLFWGRWLKKEDKVINNIVFMGMGEPFLNYNNVMAAIKIINDKDAFNIGSRHISVSTVGIVDGIKKFASESLQVNLAISLHASNDELRSKIMPVNKKYPIRQVWSAIKDYLKKTNRKVMFEYIMIKGVNDSDDCARQLGRLLEDLPRHLIMVNLISYNPTGIFQPAVPMRVKKFKDILMKAGYQAIERYRFGGNIQGACGQLTGTNNGECV